MIPKAYFVIHSVPPLPPIDDSFFLKDHIVRTILVARIVRYSTQPATKGEHPSIHKG
jgi:hypothetical protein